LESSAHAIAILTDTANALWAIVGLLFFYLLVLIFIAIIQSVYYYKTYKAYQDYVKNVSKILVEDEK